MDTCVRPQRCWHGMFRSRIGTSKCCICTHTLFACVNPSDISILSSFKRWCCQIRWFCRRKNKSIFFCKCFDSECQFGKIRVLWGYEILWNPCESNWAVMVLDAGWNLMETSPIEISTKRSCDLSSVCSLDLLVSPGSDCHLTSSLTVSLSPLFFQRRFLHLPIITVDMSQPELRAEFRHDTGTTRPKGWL